ncbi:hypothetical protein ADICYQ_5118 [Cyclobacterium qasimii M12-11B]|uniref:Uncharacterized protein n=1 Tax=Cyclobacterium qasimii M12-11B TaxID=641524 RepID=S7WNY0_9BACT|nr:hypothetical protein ADICYQ_5118 [Cyclobacterium qasimii M12-11B]
MNEECWELGLLWGMVFPVLFFNGWRMKKFGSYRFILYVVLFF